MALRCAICTQNVHTITKPWKTSQAVDAAKYHNQREIYKNQLWQYALQFARYIRGYQVFYTDIASEPAQRIYLCDKCGRQFKNLDVALDTMIFKLQNDTNLHRRSTPTPSPRRRGRSSIATDDDTAETMQLLTITPRDTPITGVLEDVSFIAVLAFFKFIVDQQAEDNAYDHSLNLVYQQIERSVVAYDQYMMELTELPALLVALYVLSPKLRQLITTAQNNDHNYFSVLYTKGHLSPEQEIKSWLLEARTNLTALQQKFINEHKRLSSVFLTQAPYLTVSAVQALLAQADNSYIPRPIYCQRTAIVTIVILLTVLLTVIFIVIGVEAERSIAMLNSTTTTTTTPPYDPCNMPQGCLSDMVEQIIANIEYLNTKGESTLTMIYGFCQRSGLFDHLLQCFPGDTDLRRMLADPTTQSQVFADYLARYANSSL